ncbi:PAS domain-containing sensor histidine kinase [Sinorhizobium medicae]|uniref:ATP-binding protein n=1 Tax=Sinorhizobium medicae TaxID=110321 RepID=UPI000FDBF28F|nr:ATP-binding protein [Sinorhizobium medicae]RVH87322.1 PAS domain-containing sensor histidine kinase [Sinorhizobium medicae]RVP66194.1 PAS domain-containing sensor histidine kinase [Sinorhizobium medicae]
MRPTPKFERREPVDQVDLLSVQIADASHESVIIYDADARIIHWNYASQRLYGRSNVEVRGKHPDEVFGADTIGPDWTELKTGGSWQGIAQRAGFGNVSVLAEIRLRALRDEEGKITRIVEHGLPADARIVEGHAPGIQKDWIAVWSIDTSGAAAILEHIGRIRDQGLTHLTAIGPEVVAEHLRISDMNVAAVRLFAGGASVTSLVGKSAYRYWPQKHRAKLLDLTIRVLQASESETPFVTATVGDDVLSVWRGKPDHPHLISTSVTGSWNGPDRYWDLAASEQRYRNLINNVPLPIWQVDARVMSDVIQRLKAAGITSIESHLREEPDLVRFASEAVVVTDVNDSAMRLFRGKLRDDFLKNVTYLFSGTPEAAMRVVKAHFDGGRNYSEEMKIRTFDGDLRDVLFYVTFPQVPEKLDKTLIMMIDVTDQRRVEQQLRKIEADFAHAARVSALGELVTSIAHEVRQPLSVIVTDADTGLRWLGRDEPNVTKVKAIIARIAENAHRANEVIRRIKEMAVKTDPMRSIVDVNDLIREALLFVKSESQTHNIAINTRLVVGLPEIFGDRVQLQQVIINLLINSIHAISGNQRPNRLISIETSLGTKADVIFSVRDTGGGIPSDDIDRIFDGFFSSKPDGMGMGLAICRSIIIDHGGTITARNDGGHGAIFEVTLPLPNGLHDTPDDPDPRSMAGR